MKGQEKNASVVLVLVDVSEHHLRCILETCTPDHFDQIILSGSTPAPDVSEQYPCRWQYLEDPVDVALKLNCMGYEISVGKLTDDSELLTEAEFTSRKIAAFVGHISERLLKQASRSIHHPLHLINESPSASIIVGGLIHDIFCRREAAAKQRLINSQDHYSDTFTVTKAYGAPLKDQWTHRSVY